MPNPSPALVELLVREQGELAARARQVHSRFFGGATLYSWRDLLHDYSLKLLGSPSIPTFANEGAFLGFCFVGMRNLAVTKLERQHAMWERQHTWLELPDFSDSEQYLERLSILNTAVSRLTPAQQAVLALRREKVDNEVIAQTLGIHHTTVRYHWHRGKEALKKALANSS